MRYLMIISSLFVMTNISWCQTVLTPTAARSTSAATSTAARSTTSTAQGITASNLTGNSLGSASGLRGNGSFRPAPAAAGRSTIRGRTLDLYSRMDQTRIYIMSAASVMPIQPNAANVARVSAIRARIAAEQQASSQLAMMGSQPAGVLPSAVSHSVVPGFKTTEPPKEYEIRAAKIEEAWGRNAAERLGIDGLEIFRQGNKTVIRGRAPDENSARVAIRLLELEPGIGEIVNQLTVGSPPPPAPAPGNE